MNCTNFILISLINATDLLTFIGILLAYLAYTWSIKRDLESWKSLLNSFKAELLCQRDWLSNEYFDYQDKNSYSPTKAVFPLSFASLPTIISRGPAELKWLPNNLISNLSLFNERIQAFNSFLSYITNACAFNAIKAEQLKDELNKIGLDDDSVDSDTFKKRILELKKENEIFCLAEYFHRWNKIIHKQLIGHKNSQDKLHYLYTEINKQLEDVLSEFDNKTPFFIKHQFIIISSSVVLFFIIEICL